MIKEISASNENVLMFCPMHEEQDNGGLIEPNSDFEDILLGRPMNGNYGKEEYYFSKRVSIKFEFRTEELEWFSKKFNITMEDIDCGKFMIVKEDNVLITMATK